MFQDREAEIAGSAHRLPGASLMMVVNDTFFMRRDALPSIFPPA
jgi:hypothetical protein